MTGDQNSNTSTNESGDQLGNGVQTGTECPVRKLNPIQVPLELHPLIPYVEKWGINDKKLQRKLLREAPLAEIEELYAILYPIWDNTWRFATSELSPEGLGSYEMKIFDNFRSVFSEASSILSEDMPQRWLEIIGWPEAFPSRKLDPVRVPAKLKTLIPYVEKWVLEDDSVRDVAIRVATSAELEEFVSTVNRVGSEETKHLALQMIDEEPQKTDGYILLEMLEVAETADYELRNRNSSR